VRTSHPAHPYQEAPVVEVLIKEMGHNRNNSKGIRGCPQIEADVNQRHSERHLILHTYTLLLELDHNPSTDSVTGFDEEWLKSGANIQDELAEGVMLDNRKSHVHTYNPPYKKIPEAVSLHISNQGSVGSICHLFGDRLGRRICFFALTIRSMDVMLIV
jgi:hypothetical protein